MPYKDLEKRRECSRNAYHRNKDKNREKRNERDRKRYQDNIDKERERIRLNVIKRRKEDPERLREVQRKWEKNKIMTDPLFKFKKNFSRKLRHNLKSMGGKKSSIQSILGINIDDFRLHLENQFESWMTWDNYGQYNGEFNYGWDIDHIIPKSSAKTYEDLVKLNHYTNLKPLCSKINRDIKKNYFR